MKRQDKCLQCSSGRLCMIPLAILLLVCCLATGCRPSSTTPEPRDVQLGGESLNVGRSPAFVSRTYAFYVGSPTDRFEMTLTLFNATTNCPLSVVSGSGAILQTITTSGDHTVQFPGNVGMLRFTSESVGDSPALNIQSVRIFPRAGAQFPSIPATMTDNMAALPVSLNNEVLLPFSASPTTYFLVAQGLGGKTVEVVLDGPGAAGVATSRVQISTDVTNGFVLNGGTPDEEVLSTQGGFKRFTLSPGRDTLLMTVRSEGATGLARLSVNEVPSSGLVSLEARFLSPSVVPETDITQLTTAVNAASQRLYQATAGRMRIDRLTIFTRAAAGGNPLAGDIFITNANAGTGAVGLPPGQVGVELGPNAFLIGGEVARAVLKQKFSLVIERSNSNGSPLCPDSLMGNVEALSLCWASNHNPTGDSNLRTEVPTSAWERLAPVLNVTAPTTTPPSILRNVSGVTFPLQVIRVN